MGCGASARPVVYGVNLHVYDLAKSGSIGRMFGDVTGLRALHTGVEVFHYGGKKPGVEYSFGPEGGVSEQAPLTNPSMQFRETSFMGTCERTPLELANIIFTARARWKGVDYSALNRNCNHFSDELVFTLVGKHIHESINRLSDTASSAIGAIGEIPLLVLCM